MHKENQWQHHNECSICFKLELLQGCENNQKNADQGIDDKGAA